MAEPLRVPSAGRDLEPARPPAAAHETLRFDIIPTARIRYASILTCYGKRWSAISLANDSGECFEPLTTIKTWSKHHANNEAGACAHHPLARNKRENLARNFCAYSFPMFEMACNRQGNILSPSPAQSALLGYKITASITLRRHLP